ncbi:MAG: class I SAM-dependent methyltransferase [Tatlockia sp.]|nr:class I SAM-dependent methyltransferase [Tatlockia sp.]
MGLSKGRLKISPEKLKNSFNYLNYQLITSNDYYKYAIDELTKENLQKWSNFSKTIEIPFKLGKFNNEEHYLKTLRLVLASTHETRNRILFFVNEILPVINPLGSLLDIGPGDGSLTLALAHHFRKIAAVDPNLHILNHLKTLLPSSNDFILIPESILNAQLQTECNNLVVLSHMLYYIDPKFWIEIISSAYSSLNENGVLVIVMGGDELGKAELINHFGGETLRIDQLAKECLKEYGKANVNLYASNESFVTSTHEAMLHISAFMLADANISTSKENLSLYINQRFHYSESHFELTTLQKYIVIRKNTLKDNLYEFETINTAN